MFHLSLPVGNFERCLDFYRDCFRAEVIMLSAGVANVFVFGGQLTLRDKKTSPLTRDGRQEMHFGQTVPLEQWKSTLARIETLGYPVSKYTDLTERPMGRAKLLLADPAGNLVEINSTAAVKGEA
jgi:extradiol dioxygenase family protein